MRMMMTLPVRMLIVLMVAIAVLRGGAANGMVVCLERSGEVRVESRHEEDVCSPCVTEEKAGEEPCEDYNLPEMKISAGEKQVKQAIQIKWAPIPVGILPVVETLSGWKYDTGDRAGDVASVRRVVRTVILLV